MTDFKNMTDTEKLNYIVALLEEEGKEEENGNLYDSCSDFQGVYYTEKYYNIQERKENFLESFR